MGLSERWWTPDWVCAQTLRPTDSKFKDSAEVIYGRIWSGLWLQGREDTAGVDRRDMKRQRKEHHTRIEDLFEPSLNDIGD